MKFRKVDLMVNPGCQGCNKDCNWRAATVAKTLSKGSTQLYGCNSSK